MVDISHRIPDGFLVDLFSYTIGLHTAACTLIVFIRPFVVRIIASKEQYEPGIQPGIKGLGFRWFLTYTLVMVSVHHLFVYLMEQFRFIGFFTFMYRSILNILITTMAIALVQILLTSPFKTKRN